MIYQYVKRYLKETFNEPSEDMVWSNLDNIAFLTYIEKRYTFKELTHEISEVKEAFKDFYSPIGAILFRYKESDGIRFKIFPYRAEPKNSKYLKDILTILNSNRKYIKYPYEEQNDQIAVLGKIRRLINAKIDDIEESVNKNELVNYAIRKSLGLNDKDIIVKLKRIYLIKIFEQNKILEAKNAEVKKRTGIDNRYNGYTKEQVDGIYADLFKKNNIENFLSEVMKKVLNNDLNFTKISNKFYDLNALKIIHNQVASDLKNYVELESDFVNGFAGYIMREHFKEIHGFIAENLLEAIHSKSENARQFLLYFNGKVIVEDGKRYTIPSLETEDGKQWNNSAIMGICALWVDARQKKKLYETRLTEINEKINEVSKSLRPIEEQKDKDLSIVGANKEKIQRIRQIISSKELKINSFKRSGVGDSIEEEKLSIQIIHNEQEVGQLLNMNKELLRDIEKAHDDNIEYYDTLDYYNQQLAQITKESKIHELNMVTNSKKLNEILESLINTLMSRRKILIN
ncbi:MAG: hypothetical protein GQ570_07030 [Helicobacteraceae bacterium]|nr:hypothetical protein [Helicobacteraceae bacterium]